MNKIQSFFLNTFYFKIAAVLVLLASSTRWTSFIYEYGIYIIVIWSCILLGISAWKKQFNYRKADLFLLMFIIGYLVTIIINLDSNVFKQVFVLMSCLMYFFVFLIADKKPAKGLVHENFVILFIIVVISFVIILISYIVFAYDMVTGANHTYNLHGGNNLQFIGIYNGLSTQAIISGISMLSSLGFLISVNNYNIMKHKKGFIAFNCINFLIQDISVTISYTAAGVVAVGAALIVGIFYVLMKKINAKYIIKIPIVIVVTLLIVIGHYTFLNYSCSMVVNSVVGTGNNLVSIQADNTTDDLFTSNGRFEIWEAAVEQWKNTPVFGNGYGTFSVEFPIEINKQIEYVEYNNTHSGYLEVLYTCGLWGFIMIMLFGVYYLFGYLKNVFVSKNMYAYIGMTMIIVHACLYAAINELFVLDRNISVLLLCIFLGLARKELAK